MSERPCIRLLKPIKIGGVVHKAKRVLTGSQVPIEHMQHYVNAGAAEYLVAPEAAPKSARKAKAPKALKSETPASPVVSSTDSDSKEP